MGAPAKKGSLGAGHKEPPFRGGLDWDKIRREYDEKMQREWDAGFRNVDNLDWYEKKEMSEREKEAAAIAQVFSTPKGRASRAGQHKSKTGRKRGTLHFDVEEVVHLYVNGGLSPLEISEKFNGKPSYPTVVNYLKKAGVFDNTRHRSGGARNRESYEEQRQQFCPRCGADLSKSENARERVRKLPDGTTRPNGRECIPCSIARKRQYDEHMREERRRNGL